MRAFPLSGVLLLSLWSCTSNNHWKHSQISGDTEQFSSSRLSYKVANIPNSMYLEIIRRREAYRGYLCVPTRSIPPHQNNPKTALISIRIDDTSESYVVSRHQGGNKLLLNQECLEKILEALEKGQSVIVQASGYTTKLEPEGFSSQYEKFRKSSRIPKLIQTPF